mmetsp:Transcript_109757/g.328090  ORF Transcript_109757/g.328090 Transcript_109757/m.328090 type:complete len:200 (+) Transcript_109757:1394-1993(+)
MRSLRSSAPPGPSTSATSFGASLAGSSQAQGLVGSTPVVFGLSASEPSRGPVCSWHAERLPRRRRLGRLFKSRLYSTSAACLLPDASTGCSRPKLLCSKSTVLQYAIRAYDSMVLLAVGFLMARTVTASVGPCTAATGRAAASAMGTSSAAGAWAAISAAGLTASLAVGPASAGNTGHAAARTRVRLSLGASPKQHQSR